MIMTSTITQQKRRLKADTEAEHGHGTPDPNAPHSTDFDKQQEHLAVFDLVPHDEATFVSIASGEWSNAAVWEGGVVPGDDAQVLISTGTTVTCDVIQYDSISMTHSV